MDEPVMAAAVKVDNHEKVQVAQWYSEQKNAAEKAGEQASKISIRDVNLHYGTFQALYSVNLELLANKVTAFIGPSGCGKSTLLKTLNRMNDLIPDCRIDGKVLLDGADIYEDVDVNILRKRVGMVFQKPNPFPMSIYDNIAYGPRTHGVKNRRSSTALSSSLW